MELLSVYTAMGFAFSVFIGSSLPKNQGTHNSLVVRCVYVVVFVYLARTTRGSISTSLVIIYGVAQRGKRVRCHSWEYSPADLQGKLQEKSNKGSNQLGRFVRMLVSSLPKSGVLHFPVPKPADHRWKLTTSLFYLVIPIFIWAPPEKFAFFTWCYRFQLVQSRRLPR